jgi:hypothetical protein
MTGRNSPALLWATSTRPWPCSDVPRPARTASTRGQYGGPWSATCGRDGTVASRAGSVRRWATGCQVRGPTEGLWIRTKPAAMAGTLADQRC